MVLTFIFRERHLPLSKVPTHLTIMTHLQNQVHIVAVLKIVIQLKEIHEIHVHICGESENNTSTSNISNTRKE